MATNKTKKRASKIDLFNHMDILILRKRSIGKDSTADLYRASSNWLRKFVNNRNLCLSEITPALVDDFIVYLQGLDSLKVNSVNSYVCAFRAMYNVITREHGYIPYRHPFAHIVIHPEKTTKRAVGLDVFERISALDLRDEPEMQKAADLCVFSFIACGMPFVDLAHLTRENINGDTLIYNRAKTGAPIRIDLTPGMNYLLDKYSSPDNPYLFSLLPPEGAVSHEHYKSLLRGYNACLKEIGKRLNLSTSLTSYVIRHSWATIAYRKYTPVAIISQALGHTSEKTTRHYLAQLDQSELSKANVLITGTVDNIVKRRA